MKKWILRTALIAFIMIAFCMIALLREEEFRFYVWKEISDMRYMLIESLHNSGIMDRTPTRVELPPRFLQELNESAEQYLLENPPETTNQGANNLYEPCNTCLKK